MMIDTRRLHVFRAIAQYRSFTRAAEELVMTQPAVSRQLAALEAEVGTQLVVRGPRRVALTPAGVALLEEAEPILASIEAAGRRMRGFEASDGGAVRLGAVPSALATFVPPALRALRARRPRIEIRTEEGWSVDLVRLALQGDLDLAIVNAIPEVAQLAEPLMHEPLDALLSAEHRFAARRRLRLRDLADDPWLVAPEPGGRQMVLAACAAAGFKPRIAGAAGWHAAGRLVAVGLGVALVPRATATRVATEPGVVVKALADGPRRELVIVRPSRSSPTAAARDLEVSLRDAVKRGR